MLKELSGSHAADQVDRSSAADERPDNPQRRRFLQVAALAVSSAILAACGGPAQAGKNPTPKELTAEAQAQQPPTPTPPEPTATPKPEIGPELLQQVAQMIGLPKKEPGPGLVRFQRIVTEPMREVLYLPIGTIVGDYAALEIPKWDTLISHRDNMINRAVIAAQALMETGDPELIRRRALRQLEDIEKRARGQSKANARGGIVGLDGDGDGIDDYQKGFYDGVVLAIERLQ